MRFTLVFTLAVIAATLLSGCASSYAKKCEVWSPYRQTFDLAWGAVERIDTWRCVQFSEVP